MTSFEAIKQSEGFDVKAIRQDFPLLDQQIEGRKLVYLDNAATTQKPQVVIDGLNHYYSCDNANVHRGVHSLSDRATECFENARNTVQHFLNAAHRHEVIWTRGTTEALNMVASGLARSHLKAGDEIVITTMEHHANIVPWQMAAQQSGAKLLVAPINEKGELDLPAFKALLSEKTAVVSVAHVSNALGTINPIENIIQSAKRFDAITVVDGAQAVSHWPIDVQQLDCDFYAFSGHKLFGPTGIGVLYGKEKALEQLPPFLTGGEMIQTVTFESATWNELPYKFEAGTQHIAGAIGLAAAIDYLNGVDRVSAMDHEARLLKRCNELSENLGGLHLYGRAENKTAIFSFLMEGGHPNDVGTLLNQQGIAVRTGHHCTMPLMNHYGIPGTVRAAFAFYNTEDEVEMLFSALKKVQAFF